MSRRALFTPGSSPSESGYSWGAAVKRIPPNKPWNVFAGFGDRRPFTSPSTADWEVRVSRNVRHFSTNYAIISAGFLALLLVQHLPLLIWGGFLGFCWTAVKSYLFTPEGHAIPPVAAQFGKLTGNAFVPTAVHARLVFVALCVAVVLVQVGLDLFTYLGMTLSLILSHAFFRTPSSDEFSDHAFAHADMPPNAGSAFLHSSATEVPVV